MEPGAAAARFTERFILAQDGLSLYARDYDMASDGPAAVLCLAGMTRNSKDFAHVAAVLARRRRVICPDYRGRGLSDYDRDWRRYEPMVHLDDLLHLLAALNVHKVVVIGTSLGGILAMGLAVLRPGIMAGVVLNDIGPEIATGGLSRILDYVGHDRPQPDWAAAAAEMQRTFGYLELGDAQSWEHMARATYKESPDGLLRFDWDVRLVRAFRRSLRDKRDLWPYFRALRAVPTLAIRGEMSRVFLPACLARMTAEKPDLVAVTVPGVGHTPNLGEPVAIAALDRFLSRLP
jgi:pimeloyl-ACP methyl ester carboxylesterase